MSGASRFFSTTKGGQNMDCKHEQIKCVNCVKFCLKCGKELPADFIPGKYTSEATEAAETPVKGEKKTRKKVTK